MNFLEAIKARQEDKQVVYKGIAYDFLEPFLEIKGNEVFLRIKGGLRSVPIGCIKKECWEVFEETSSFPSGKKKTLSDKRFMCAAHEEDYAEEDVKQSLKEFIERTKVATGDDKTFVKDIAKEIFGERLIE